MTMDKISDAALAELVGVSLEAPCNWPAHTLGGIASSAPGDHHGCTPHEPGTYVIRTRDHGSHELRPQIVLLVCQTRMAWLRTHASATAECGHCEARFTIDEQFEFLGHVREYRP